MESFTSDIQDVYVETYSTVWDINYATPNLLTKQSLVETLIQASENYYCMAKDLSACALPSTSVVRSKLQLLIRAFAESVRTFHNEHQNDGHEDGELRKSLEKLPERFNAIAIELIGLGENLDQPLVQTAPQYGMWLLPNAQALELLVAAVLETLKSPDAKLGDLKSKLDSTAISKRQIKNASNTLAVSGLPIVVFVCMADRIVGCNGDQWGSFLKFNEECRARRKQRFTDDVRKMQIQALGSASKRRFEYVTRWLGGKNPETGDSDPNSQISQATFSLRAQERNLKTTMYNKIVECMYGNNPGVTGPSLPNLGNFASQNLPQEFGFDHRKESGRPFMGSGIKIFTPISRCWKCRFVFHYKVGRPGTTGADYDEIGPEDPRQTAWIANEPLVCAEDLVHFRCQQKNPILATKDSLIFKPFPNSS